MLFDARTVASGSTLDADVAIVGGGLCGLTLAQELARTAGLRIAILESGGLQPQDGIDDLNRGTARIHDPYSNVRVFDDHMHESRCRALGGSGHLWGGKCAELDPIDFETRRWIEHSGWPFDYAHLKPYLDRACQVMELPVFQRNSTVDETCDRAPVLINREHTVTTALRRHSAIAGRAPQNRFESFITRIASLAQVSIYLRATVVSLQTAQDDPAISKLSVRNSAGASFFVRARTYVLAAGGLENARLLLMLQPGKVLDLAGRFFTGHVIYRRTSTAPEPNHFIPKQDPARFALYVDKDPRQLQGVLQLTRNAQKRERLPNCSLTLEPPTAPGAALPLFFMLEQRPHPDSRLTLTNDRDSLGMPRLHLDWRFQEQDFLDLQRAAALFADEIARHGLGKLRFSIEPTALIHLIETARHHMGTTRMHVSPQQGVVNEHCRAHDFANLYIAGTSVFPTGGVGNPTLSLLALTLRLADYLRERVLVAPRAREISPALAG
jgi:GMC oxidoreductase